MSSRFLASLCPGAALLALLLACSERAPTPPLGNEAQTLESTPTDQSAFAGTLPVVDGPDGYLGSQSCRECHKDEYASWHKTYHRTMTQVASDESVKADFDNVELTTETTRFLLSRKDGEYWVRMEPLDQPINETGAREGLDQRIGLVTGSHHMQVFWVPEGNGNLQLGFPFTWLIPEKRWVPRNSTFVRPPDLPHHAELWNVVCSRCHTTGVEPKVNFAARTAETHVAELGISCEACHGPGERHVKAQNIAATKGSIQAGEIIQPKKLVAERSSQVCGFCHSMKWMDRNNDWRQTGFDYRPGDDLEKTTPVIRPSKIDAIEGLKDYLARNPDLLRDFFWSDGMIRVSGREYNGLIESPCYKGGKFSCVSCHSMHESDPNDQLALKATSNGACTQCHTDLAESAKLTAHTRHLATSTGSECYNCHMPHTSYGILKAIRSHEISSPNVAADLATGRPNACNLCHLDQTLPWTAKHLEQWYAQPFPDMPSTGSNISHLVRLALVGDVGQRVLAAWHFSWEPAIQASGKEWTLPVLAQLLDDPYAAVRCVAERSWNGVSKISLPGFDFAADPRGRSSARELLWPQWEQQNHELHPELSGRVLIRGGRIQRDLFDDFLRKRDTRPVRLRE